MTQEDKELVLKDIYTRLPYGVMCQCKTSTYKTLYTTCLDELFDINHGRLWLLKDKYAIIRPYLRPLSSLTKDERQEIGSVIQKDCPTPYGEIKQEGVDNLLLASTIGATNLVDWFCKNHFDYRGLIPKGLAFEAPEGMY